MKLSLIIGPLATINMLMNSWYVYSNNGVWKQMHRGHQQTQHHILSNIYMTIMRLQERKRKKKAVARVAAENRSKLPLNTMQEACKYSMNVFFFFCCCCGFSWTVQCPAMVKIYYINILIRNFDEKRCA